MQELLKKEGSHFRKMKIIYGKGCIFLADCSRRTGLISKPVKLPEVNFCVFPFAWLRLLY